jgi:nucleoside-triphosphatase
MNILLTGQPHSGKSTLIKNVVDGIEHKLGFFTQELTNDGIRTGFKLVSSLGDHALLADERLSGVPRVSRYGVDVSNLNAFLAKLPKPSKDDLLYIDEIGQMQLLSEAFKRYVVSCLDSSNPFLGTLTSVYDDPFTHALRSRDDVEVLELTLDSREKILDVIAAKIAAQTS